MVKNQPAMRRPGFDPWVGKIPWRRARQPISVFLLGEFPWTEEPGGLQSMGLWRVGHDWVTKHTAHTVKGFHVVNEAEIDVFLEFPCFSYDPADVGNLISGSSAFSESSLYIWKFLIHILQKPSLKDFEHNLTSMWNEHNCMVVWTFFGIALLWDWNESWLFGSAVKNLPAMQESQETQVQTLVRKILWRRKWQTTPVFLPVKSHRQRSLVCYSPKGCTESDMTEHEQPNSTLPDCYLASTLLIPWD